MISHFKKGFFVYWDQMNSLCTFQKGHIKFTHISNKTLTSKINSISQINKTIIPNRWGCIEKGMSIWGLARYSVKMTATSGPFWKATTKPWNYLYGVFLVSSWLIDSGSYKKNQRSHITNHTSHITNHTFHNRKLPICLMHIL